MITHFNPAIFPRAMDYVDRSQCFWDAFSGNEAARRILEAHGAITTRRDEKGHLILEALHEEHLQRFCQTERGRCDEPESNLA